MKNCEAEDEVEDIGLVHVNKAGKNIYCAETYLSNWYEETVRNTVKRHEFLQKRESEALKIQKTQIMVDLLLKPVALTERKDTDQFLHYGDTVQIVAPGPTGYRAQMDYSYKKYCSQSHLALSCAIKPHVVDRSPFLNIESLITASEHLFPCVRNSFIIEHPNGQDCENGTLLNFGDIFRIRACPTQRFEMFLHSAPASRHHFRSDESGLPLVRLSDTCNANTLWKAHPLDLFQEEMMEIGIPVPLHCRLLIKHAMSGNNLSWEPEFNSLNFFSLCECEVTVESKLDQRSRRPDFANHWSFDTARGKSNTDVPDPELARKAEAAAKYKADIINRSASEKLEMMKMAAEDQQELSPKQEIEEAKQETCECAKQESPCGVPKKEEEESPCGPYGYEYLLQIEEAQRAKQPIPYKYSRPLPEERKRIQANQNSSRSDRNFCPNYDRFY